MQIENLITQRPKGRRALTQWYGALFEASQQAGIPLSQLANRIGVTPGALYARRRIQRQECTGQISQKPLSESQGPHHIVQLAVTNRPPAAPTPERFEVRLQNGRSLLLPEHFDSARLSSLVEALEQC